MDFCFNCGGKTDPDWVFCRSCGSVLEDDDIGELPVPAESSQGAAPKVELISRGWDVVDVDTVRLPADPLESDELSAGPLPSGTIEVSAGDITVVAQSESTEPAQEAPVSPDPWDHLRPHGEMPPRQHYVTIPGRIGQVTVLLAAVAAVAAAGVHFFLNTRLDALSKGTISAAAVDDVELIADISLAVVAALLAVAGVALGWWLIRVRSTADLRPGKAGIATILSLLAGIAVVATSFAIKKDTVTEAIAANSLIVLGLGLVLTSCVAAARTVQRIDLEERG